MPKITILGAGSHFAETFATDIMLVPELEGGELCLVDTDPKRLRLSEGLIKKVAALLGKEGLWRVRASTDRRRVMANSDYLINSIEVAGLANIRHEYEIPRKYGVEQCIGDTIGPGGLFKALRTIPTWIGILRDAERLCPDALVLNYTNPMSMMTLAALRASGLPVVGLCHSVQGTLRRLARFTGVPHEEMRWRCAGINHMAWFTELSHRGKDLYPRLRKRALHDPEIYEQDPVRFDIMLHFGYFVTESSGHFSEYVPYYRKRKDLIRKYCRKGFGGGSGFYAGVWRGWRERLDAKRRRQLRGAETLPTERSHEFASTIIEAAELNRPAVIHGSVFNNGLIENLPADGVVEVACVVDRNGVRPTRHGRLPAGVAALCAANMHVFDLGVTAALSADRDALYHAMMLDPLTAAVLAPAEIKGMTDEMIKAGRRYIPKL